MGEKKYLFVFLIFLIGFVSAANLGISPASLTFDNVMRGGYAESGFVVSSDSKDLINVSFETYGEISDWINYSKKSLLVSSDELEDLRVWVEPPSDISNGNYSGYLRVLSSPGVDEMEGHAVGKIKSTIDLKITVTIIDEEIKKCVANNFSILSSEKGDNVVFSLDIKNNGNVLISPDVLLSIFDNDKIEIVKDEEFVAEDVSPTEKKHFQFLVGSDDLDVSQYWAEISVPECSGSSLLTFDILEEGAVQSKGVLLNILMNKNGEIGDVVPIEVGFKNTGEKSVVAKFSGTVSYDGSVFKHVESEEVDVERGEISKFNLYFTPEKKGKYIVSGKVIYDGKRTYEKSSSVEIYGSEFSLTYFVYGIFILIILILLYKIKEEKRRIKEKLK